VNVDNVYVAGFISLSTGAGNDRVVLGATGVVSTSQGCTLSTGDGSDVIRAEAYKVFINHRLVIHTGGGPADSVTLIGASSRADITIENDGLTGASQMFLQGVTAGAQISLSSSTPINSIAVLTSATSESLFVGTESGQNSVYLDTCYARDLIRVISVSRHSDPNPPGPISAPYNIDATVTIARCQSIVVGVFTGGGDEPLVYLGGNDTVTLYGNTVVNPTSFAVMLDTGDGNDTVEASFNVALGNFFASLTDGDDTLTLSGNSLGGFASADGGAGTNRLSQRNNQFGGLFASRFS
jgi:hypothetical protein